MTRALFLLPLLAGIALPCLAQAELRIFKIEPDKKRIIVRFDSDSPLGKQDRLKVQTYSSQGGNKTTCAFTVTAISGSLAAARSSNCPDVSILSTDAPVTREGGKFKAFG
ncbi:hypothetical protein EBZ37_05720, partial [bacterium]|nr:hypothetical protein [bacterium]